MCCAYMAWGVGHGEMRMVLGARGMGLGAACRK